MGYSDELRSRASSIWQSEKRHPFVVGIGDGSLPLDRFRYYMCQDYLFLIDYARVLAMAAAKADELQDMSWFARLLHETLNIEMALHRSFALEFGIGSEELEATRASPTTHAYTRHLLQVAYSGSLGEIAVSLLPCQWGYCEIGQYLASMGKPGNHPLYAKWIGMYSSSEFAALADWLRELVDRIGQSASLGDRGRMEEAFLLSSRYEHLFWDACYRMEEWPV